MSCSIGSVFDRRINGWGDTLAGSPEGEVCVLEELSVGDFPTGVRTVPVEELRVSEEGSVNEDKVDRQLAASLGLTVAASRA